MSILLNLLEVFIFIKILMKLKNSSTIFRWPLTYLPLLHRMFYILFYAIYKNTTLLYERCHSVYQRIFEKATT